MLFVVHTFIVGSLFWKYCKSNKASLSGYHVIVYNVMCACLSVRKAIMSTTPSAARTIALIRHWDHRLK